jgi:hypothetical protein
MRKSGDLPELAELITITEKYKTYCKSIDRSLKDGEGWINGKFWENDWTTPEDAPEPEWDGKGLPPRRL